MSVCLPGNACVVVPIFCTKCPPKAGESTVPVPQDTTLPPAATTAQSPPTATQTATLSQAPTGTTVPPPSPTSTFLTKTATKTQTPTVSTPKDSSANSLSKNITIGVSVTAGVVILVAIILFIMRASKKKKRDSFIAPPSSAPSQSSAAPYHYKNTFSSKETGGGVARPFGQATFVDYETSEITQPEHSSGGLVYANQPIQPLQAQYVTTQPIYHQAQLGFGQTGPIYHQQPYQPVFIDDQSQVYGDGQVYYEDTQYTQQPYSTVGQGYYDGGKHGQGGDFVDGQQRVVDHDVDGAQIDDLPHTTQPFKATDHYDIPVGDMFSGEYKVESMDRGLLDVPTVGVVNRTESEIK